MERAQSVPAREPSGVESNPWYSQKAKDECRLQALRPVDLPMSPDGGDSMGDPLQSSAGEGGQLFQATMGPTGKGRGGGATGEFALQRSAVSGHGDLRTEGVMPVVETAVKSMGSVSHANGKLEGDQSLQRALEGELVDFLRRQNSMLMEELATLKTKLEIDGSNRANTGMESSPWSAVNGVESTSSSAAGVVSSQGRSGRDGSRTPRSSKTRDAAVSPERKKEPHRFTPNGTKVPDGPPPRDELCWPPIPPIPGVENEQNVVETGNMSGLYDTCESKPRVRNGDREWKPQCEGVVSASEAKQFWLEQEVHALRSVLNKVSIPTAFHESGYWNGGFESRINSQHASFVPGASLSVGGSGVDRLLHRASMELGGSGDDRLPHRAPHGSSGDDCLLPRAAFAGSQTVPGGGRAVHVHGEHLGHDRADKHGGHQGDARASFEHGEHRCDGRALGMHGDLPARARASSMNADGVGLPDGGYGRSKDLPRHGVGGGGFGDGSYPGRTYGPWTEHSGGSMNTKGELPDLLRIPLHCNSEIGFT